MNVEERHWIFRRKKRSLIQISELPTNTDINDQTGTKRIKIMRKKEKKNHTKHSHQQQKQQQQQRRRRTAESLIRQFNLNIGKIVKDANEDSCNSRYISIYYKRARYDSPIEIFTTHILYFEYIWPMRRMYRIRIHEY